MSVIENITLGPVKVLGVPGKAAADKGMALLERVGLAARRGNIPTARPAASSSAWLSCAR